MTPQRSISMYCHRGHCPDLSSDIEADAPRLDLGEEADGQLSYKRFTLATSVSLIMTGSHERCQSTDPKIRIADS